MDQLEAQSRQILACLGDSSRFRLVLSLLERERCVSELAGDVGLSQSCTTRHLQYLEREGLVRGVRQGKRVVFRLQSDRPRVRELLAWVKAAPRDAMLERVSGAAVHTEDPPEGGGARPGSSREWPPQARQPIGGPSHPGAEIPVAASLVQGADGSRGPGGPPGAGRHPRRTSEAGMPESADGPVRAAMGSPAKPGNREAPANDSGEVVPAAPNPGEAVAVGRSGDLEDWLL